MAERQDGEKSQEDLNSDFNVCQSKPWMDIYIQCRRIGFFEFHYTVAFNVVKMQARIYSINKGGNAKYV